METSIRTRTHLPFELTAWLALWLLLTERGTAQSTRDCMDGFNWMSNQHGQSPCVIAAKVIGLSRGGDPPANIGTIGSSGQFVPPGSPETIQDAMTCSWVFYNLVQACAICQGGRAQNWVFWSGSGCRVAGLVSSDSYWPDGHSFNSQTSFPQYSIYNPTNWLNGMFDLQQARQIASQNLLDVTGTGAQQPNPTSTSTSIPPPQTASSNSLQAGALAGIIVGGCIGLGILAALLWWLLVIRPRERKRQPQQKIDLNDEKGVPPPSPIGIGINGAKIDAFTFPGSSAGGAGANMQAHAVQMSVSMAGSGPNGVPQSASLYPVVYSSQAQQPTTPPQPFASMQAFPSASSPPPGQRFNPMIIEKQRRHDRTGSTDSLGRTFANTNTGYAFNLPTVNTTPQVMITTTPEAPALEKPGDASTPKPSRGRKAKGKSRLSPMNADLEVSHTDIGHNTNNDAHDNNATAVGVQQNSGPPQQWSARHVTAFIAANPGARAATERDREQPPPEY